MIDTRNKKFDVNAEIFLRKPVNTLYKKPADDVVNWLHIQLKNRHTIFYKISDPSNSEYNKKFRAVISFVDNDIVQEIVDNKEYDLYRGPEKIGTIQILKK